MRRVDVTKIDGFRIYLESHGIFKVNFSNSLIFKSVALCSYLYFFGGKNQVLVYILIQNPN